ncbi:MAG: DUF4292 domain-containing protein [Ferruginibacter sp.]
MKFYFAIICAFTLISSCHSARKSAGRSVSPVPAIDTLTFLPVAGNDSIEKLNNALAAFNKNKIDFSTFSAKIDVDAEDNKGKKPGVSATLRMIKDSAIWISISATFLNIEVYRVFINRDSIVVMNKTDKTVAYKSIGYLQEVTNIPLSFIDLQNLLIGNAIFVDGETVSLLSNDNLITLLFLSSGYTNYLTLGINDYSLVKSVIKENVAGGKRSAELEFSDFVMANNLKFSTKRRILARDENTLDIHLNFRQFEFNKQLSVAFSVPKNYKSK